MTPDVAVGKPVNAGRTKLPGRVVSFTSEGRVAVIHESIGPFSELLKMSENGLFKMPQPLTRSLTKQPNSVSIDQNAKQSDGVTNSIESPFLGPAVNLHPGNVLNLNVCVIKYWQNFLGIFYYFFPVVSGGVGREGREGGVLTQFVRSPFFPQWV